jgi:hypothetical protein
MPVVARERLAALTEHGVDFGLALHHHRNRGMMEDVRMVAIDGVFQRHFPVAAIRMLEDAGAQDDFAYRGEINELVDQAFGRAEMLFERRSCLAQAGEDEPAIASDARNLGESEFIFAK